MSQKKKDFLLDLLVGAVIAVAVFSLNMSRDYGFTRSLCDGLFVAAGMLLGIGGIKGVRNKGAFDVVGYGVKSALETALPVLRRGEKEDIHQYVQRKASQRTSSRGLLLAGAVYFVLSLVALAIYHKLA